MPQCGIAGLWNSDGCHESGCGKWRWLGVWPKPRKCERHNLGKSSAHGPGCQDFISSPSFPSPFRTGRVVGSPERHGYFPETRVPEPHARSHGVLKPAAAITEQLLAVEQEQVLLTHMHWS